MTKTERIYQLLCEAGIAYQKYNDERHLAMNEAKTSAEFVAIHDNIKGENEFIAEFLAENGVEVVVRCKNCEHCHKEQEAEHGKTVRSCPIINAETFKDFYCYHGKEVDTNKGTEVK